MCRTSAGSLGCIQGRSVDVREKTLASLCAPNHAGSVEVSSPTGWRQRCANHAEQVHIEWCCVLHPGHVHLPHMDHG